MANKITWADKVALQEKPDVVAENKVTAADMNQIKTAVNETIEEMPSNLKNGIAEGSVRTVGSAEESDSYKLGTYAFAEGQGTIASGNRSHAEGINTTASGNSSHAEGGSTTASFDYSHAEGAGTRASGYASHAEGGSTTASGDYSHAGGTSTTASGQASHAEGNHTTASGNTSHAEGGETTASGHTSHAEGSGTTAQGNNQHVQGKFNIADKTSAHIVGNGSRYSNKSNAHTLDWSGNAWFAGDVYTGSTSGKNKDDGSKKLATEEYVINLVGGILSINNASFHNSIFRGKDITSYFTDGSLYNRIANGTFEDLFVGDYIIQNNITWRIAGFDIHLNKGDQPLITHHAVIVPDSNLTTEVMNWEGSTEGGYVGSLVYGTTLPSVLTDYITPVFGNHIIEYRAFLTNGINPTGYNSSGTNDGCSNSCAWLSRKLDLMDECEVYGCPIWSSSAFDCGSAYTQLPLFALAPQYILSDESYWLKDVSTSHSYASVTNSGIADGAWTAVILGVRPRFLID